MNNLTQRGIAALKAGDRDAARRWLGAAIQQNPSDIQAWIWLSGAVDRDNERFDCLRQVLRIDPSNQNAARGLAQLIERNPQFQPAIRPAHPPKAPAAPAPEANHHEVVVEADLLDRAVAGLACPANAHEHPVAPAPPAAKAPASNTRVIHPSAPPRPRPVYSTQRTIFSTRPSMIPVVLYFWLVIFTIYGLMFYLAEQITVIFPAVATLAGTCFFIVIYLLIRIAATRYELSNHKLTIPWQGRRTVVGLPSILNVDTQQSGLQKLLGAGDIVLDAAVNGVLSTLHIRNIPQVEQRADQIRALLSELR